jgi:hypothetical protein
MNDIFIEQDFEFGHGETVEKAIEYLSKYTGKGYTIESDYYGYNNERTLNIVLKETTQQKKERLAKEKAEKKAKKLESERKRYLELKAKFEGEQT